MIPVVEKMRALFIISFLAIPYVEALDKKKVCVIGAGRAGLAAIKIVADHIDKFEPIGFERNSDVGGLWIYREDPELDEHGLPAHSGIYKNLRTITYKNFMTYPDYLTIRSSDDSKHLSHESFLEYMRNYTDHFHLRKYIKFNTLVLKVTPLKDKCRRGKTRWLLVKQNLKTYQNGTTICDAVIVCNGRFSKPNIPKIPGIDTFPGLVLHSRSYRRPQDFTNKTVVLLGAGLSGVSIARDLGPFAKEIYLSHKRKDFFDDDGFTDNVFVVKNVIAADGNQLILQDRSKITADVLIYCTGYLYDFPFLDESSGIIPDGHDIQPLIRGFINQKYPSMAFIGLGPANVFGFHFYSETKDFLKSLQGNKS